MRIVTCTTLFLALSTLYPAFARDNAKPSVSTKQQKSVDQSAPDNRTVGRDWKVKPSDDRQTEGKAGGMTPDSAKHYDQKIDRDWRLTPAATTTPGE